MSYSLVDTPESIPRVFVEAWGNRDADKLAALFDEDAEFVNVTGLWWHDRNAIQKAHAYGFERIFDGSTLRIVQVKVKSMSHDIAVVHAKVRLERQTAAAGVEQPTPRITILSFVVHRVADGWSCASAQNTDVAPHMETNIVDDAGNLRPVSYRKP